MKFLRVLKKRLRRTTKPFRDMARAFPDLLKIPQRLARIEEELASQRREARVLHVSRALPPVQAWRGRPEMIPADPGMGVLSYSTGCRQAEFEQPWFSYWTAQFHVRLLYH